MKKGNRDGKIIDGQSYESALPEAYAKVKHQRDQVVAGFNILKERQRDLEETNETLVNIINDIIYNYRAGKKRQLLGSLAEAEAYVNE